MTRKSSQISQREQNATRLRRAESWLELSEKSQSDDEKFIFLWISFNAAYGTKLPDTSDNGRSTASKEWKRFTEFVDKIVERDRKGAIKKGFHEKFTNPIRKLKDNEYVFGPFWSYVQERPQGRTWRSQFKQKNQTLDKALEEPDVSGVLKEVLSRLYVLRNQIIHGGTTFAEGWGRDQVRDGSEIMGALMPLILKIMQDDIDKNRDSEVWGILDYPRVGDDDQPDRMPSI